MVDRKKLLEVWQELKETIEVKKLTDDYSIKKSNQEIRELKEKLTTNFGLLKSKEEQLKVNQETIDNYQQELSSLRFFKTTTEETRIASYNNYQRETELRKKGKTTLISHLNQVKNKLGEAETKAADCNE